MSKTGRLTFNKTHCSTDHKIASLIFTPPHVTLHRLVSNFRTINSVQREESLGIKALQPGSNSIHSSFYQDLLYIYSVLLLKPTFSDFSCIIMFSIYLLQLGSDIPHACINEVVSRVVSIRPNWLSIRSALIIWYWF